MNLKCVYIILYYIYIIFDKYNLTNYPVTKMHFWWTYHLPYKTITFKHYAVNTQRL